MSQPVMTYTTLATWSSKSADSDGHPSTFVSLVGIPQRGHKPRIVELAFASVPTTSGSPTAVLVDLYKKVEVVTTYVATWTIASTDITASRIGSFMTDAYADQFAARVRFSGGTSPTVTATLKIRAVE